MSFTHFESSPHLQSMLTVGNLSVRGLPCLNLGVISRQPFQNFNASLSMATGPLQQKRVSTKSSCTPANGCGGHTKSFLGASKKPIGLSELLQDFPSQQKVSWRWENITLLWLIIVLMHYYHPEKNASSQTSSLSFQRSFSQQPPPSKPVLTLFTKVRFSIFRNQSRNLSQDYCPLCDDALEELGEANLAKVFNFWNQ